MEVYCYVFLGLFILVTAVWLYYLKTNVPSAIDGAWSLGIMGAGLAYLYLQPERYNLVIIISSFLLIAWGIRLAAYMWYDRISKYHVDKRYLELCKDWKIDLRIGFLFNFLFQGLLMFGISISFYFIAYRSQASIGMIDYILLAVIAASTGLEVLADKQLRRFKRDNTGKVCDVGLWKIARHPNYFFDFMIWLCFALIALPAESGYIALVSPLIMLWIFLYISIPISEKLSLESRGEAYAEYQRKTAKFIPWIY